MSKRICLDSVFTETILIYSLIILALVNLDLATLLFLATATLAIGLMETRLPKFRIKLDSAGLITASNGILVKLVLVTIGLLFLTCFGANIFIILMSLAALLNALPKIVNNGFMPCLPDAYIKACGYLRSVDAQGEIQDNLNQDYCYIGSETKLSFLGDRFYVKYLDSILSVGDFCLIGALIFGIISQLIHILKPA